MKHMSKKKQFLLLAAVLLALAAAYLAIEAYQDWSYKKESREASEKLEITNLDGDSISSIRYSDTSETMEFTKEADAWYYEGDRELPLKQSCAEDAVDEFSKLEGTRRLTGAEEMASYGLDDPAYEIRLTDENGKETVVQIGDTSDSEDSEYYITADEGETIFTIGSSVPDSLIFDETSLIQNETFPEIDSSNLKEITIRKNGKVLDSCKSTGDEEDEEDEDLTTYGSELSGLSLDTCVTYNVKNGERKQYGLNQKARREVTAVYEDTDSGEEKTQVFYLGAVFEEEESDYVYLQLKGSKMIYKVFVSDTEKLISFD